MLCQSLLQDLQFDNFSLLSEIMFKKQLAKHNKNAFVLWVSLKEWGGGGVLQKIKFNNAQLNIMVA